MSAENIRRRLVMKLGGKPDAAYIDKISDFLQQQEKSKKAEVEIITRSKKKNTLIFTLDNGDIYELYNYADPPKDRPTPKGEKPPEIQIRKIDKMEGEEIDSGPFTIVDFVLWSVYIGLAFLSLMIASIIYNFKFELPY
ncbi:MAG: hypothetical protein LBC75_10635 [Fibromonadaceae bacterium]|jgi:hypothetical protein|nr:hypothetical protein [Fibromonadaceae bacterium]